ncbi:hypothetical protein [Streptomyces sp. NPDC001667]
MVGFGEVVEADLVEQGFGDAFGAVEDGGDRGLAGECSMIGGSDDQGDAR